MGTIRRTSVVLVAVLAGFGVAALAAQGSGSGGSGSASHRASGRLQVGVSVMRFEARGRKLIARGQVAASFTDSEGHRVRSSRTAVLAATTGGSCRVLHLFLDQLNLRLLGLTAHLDKVNLNITGNRRGGVLGRLFCQLTAAKLASTRARAARAMTATVRKNGGQAVRFTANVNAQQAAAASRTCEVLDLIVGPLNLQLLGLVVDLNKVHLSIIARRGGGKLGDIFCTLADDSPPPTTSTTATAATTPSTTPSP
jgi:hypothetical protein